MFCLYKVVRQRRYWIISQYDQQSTSAEIETCLSLLFRILNIIVYWNEYSILGENKKTLSIWYTGCSQTLDSTEQFVIFIMMYLKMSIFNFSRMVPFLPINMSPQCNNKFMCYVTLFKVDCWIIDIGFCQYYQCTPAHKIKISWYSFIKRNPRNSEISQKGNFSSFNFKWTNECQNDSIDFTTPPTQHDKYAKH
jgi:hypothetical protein